MNILDRIEMRSDEFLTETDEVRFKGQRYKIGGVTPAGVRELIGPEGSVVGTYNPTTDKAEVTGGGFVDDEEAAGFTGPPKISGWEVTWESPQFEPGLGRVTASGKSGTYFPMDPKVEYRDCPVCKGTKKVPGSEVRAEPLPGQRKGKIVSKAKPCTNCYGTGVLNPRVDAYVQTLKKQGRAPKVKAARVTRPKGGESIDFVSKYPVAKTLGSLSAPEEKEE